MAGSPIVVAVRPSWALAFRGAIYDALFSGHRGFWLARLAFALLMGVAARATFGDACDVTDGAERPWFGTALLLVPTIWFYYPLARVRAASAHTVTFLDEGLSVEGQSHSLSVAWSAVRSVRRTLWDLVVVLDGSTISLPRSSLPAGTVEAVIDLLGAPTTAPTPSDGSGDAHSRTAYRTAEARAPGPEDEEASAREWVAPSDHHHLVLAFPGVGDHVGALLSLKRATAFRPAVLMVLGGLLVLLGTRGGADRAGEVIRFTNLGLVLLVLGVASFLVDLVPALLALRDRAVRERSAGVLYALGPNGLYVRSKSFEQREPWARVALVRAGSARVSLLTARAVHTIPCAAFESDAARAVFVKTLERLGAARPSP